VHLRVPWERAFCTQYAVLAVNMHVQQTLFVTSGGRTWAGVVPPSVVPLNH
jgi:hypothetical protein